MSYILDALKRADAERERGAVPGLHAHQLATQTDSTTPYARKSLGLGLLAAIALAGLAISLWLWQTPTGEQRVAVMAPMQAQPAAPTAVTQAPMATVSTPVPVPTAAMPVPTTTPTPTTTSMPAKAAVPLARASALAPSTAALNVPLLSEMPDDFRRQIPALTISGAVYSSNPGQRLLLLNGQVVTQGGLAAPDLILEEIGARSSTFSFRGSRFRLAH